MDNMIKQAFDGMVMPEPCAEKIQQAMGRKNENHRPRSAVWRAAAAAACLLLVLAVFSNPTVVQALEEVFVPVTFGTDNAFYIDSGRYSYYKNGTGGEGDHNWNVPSGVVSGRLDTDPWLVQEDDRLFFTANGEMIDITDRISFETPFTYIYVDKHELIHYMAVGGEFEAEQGVESVGTIEYIRYKPAMDAEPGAPRAGWMGGRILGSDTATAQTGFYTWVWKAYEILELPGNFPEYAFGDLTLPER